MNKVAIFRTAEMDDSGALLAGVRLEYPDVSESDLLITNDFQPMAKFLLRVEKNTATGKGSALIYKPADMTAKQTAAIEKFGKVGVALIGVSESFDADKGASPEAVATWLQTGEFSEAVEEPEEEDPLSIFEDFDEDDEPKEAPAPASVEAPSAPDEMPVIAAPVMPGEEEAVAPAPTPPPAVPEPAPVPEPQEEESEPPSLSSLIEEDDVARGYSGAEDDDDREKEDLWESFSTKDASAGKPVAPAPALDDDDWAIDAVPETDDDELFDAAIDTNAAPPPAAEQAPEPVEMPSLEPEPPAPAPAPDKSPKQDASHLDAIEDWASNMVSARQEGVDQARAAGLLDEQPPPPPPLPPEDDMQPPAPVAPSAPAAPVNDSLHENGQRVDEMLPSRIPEGMMEDRTAGPVSLYENDGYESDDIQFGTSAAREESAPQRPYASQQPQDRSAASRERAVSTKAGMRTSSLPGTRPGVTTLVTGSHGGCGKTTISYLMPYVMAYLMKEGGGGKPVYLIEADYSNPKLAQRFSLKVDQDSGQFAKFVERLSSGQIESMSRDEVLAETKRIIEEITYVDEFTGLRVIACPYDTTSRTTDNLRDSIQKLVNTLAKEECYIFIDGQTFSKDDVLDSTLAATADNVVLVGNGRHVEDAQSFRHMLTTPVESNGAGVSQDRVNIFLNQTSESRKIQLEHEFLPTPVIGFLPQLPEIDDATDDATTAWVGKSLHGPSLQVAVTFTARAMKEFMPKSVAPLLDGLANRSTDMKAVAKKKKRGLFSRG